MDLDKIVKKIRNSELSEDDVLKYGRILINEFAKEYHKKQLMLGGVSITLPPNENIINAMKLLAEIDYTNEWVWGHDTDLGKPEDVIKDFKNELLGN